jgi:hypothetical protein
VDCIKVIRALNIKKIIYSVDGNQFCMSKPTDYSINHRTLGRRLLDLSQNQNSPIQVSVSVSITNNSDKTKTKNNKNHNHNHNHNHKSYKKY